MVGDEVWWSKRIKKWVIELWCCKTVRLWVIEESG